MCELCGEESVVKLGRLRWDPQEIGKRQTSAEMEGRLYQGPSHLAKPHWSKGTHRPHVVRKKSVLLFFTIAVVWVFKFHLKQEGMHTNLRSCLLHHTTKKKDTVKYNSSLRCTWGNVQNWIPGYLWLPTCHIKGEVKHQFPRQKTLSILFPIPPSTSCTHPLTTTLTPLWADANLINNKERD